MALRWEISSHRSWGTAHIAAHVCDDWHAPQAFSREVGKNYSENPTFER